MSDDLRVNLGKSTVEKKQDSDFPWAPGVWEAALTAFANGWRMPEIRKPVMIGADCVIRTPEQLQELAGLDSPPEVIETTKTYPYGDEYVESLESQKVTICDITLSQLDKLEERVEYEEWSICVWFKGKKRFLVVPLSLKDGKEENVPQGNGVARPLESDKSA